MSGDIIIVSEAVACSLGYRELKCEQRIVINTAYTFFHHHQSAIVQRRMFHTSQSLPSLMNSTMEQRVVTIPLLLVSHNHSLHSKLMEKP